MRETVLIAICGQSPAVLTETVWALAAETPPVVPSEIVVLTTAEGRDCLRRELLESGVWQRLRRTLGAKPNQLRFGSDATIQVAGSPDGDANAADIASAATADAFADLTLRVLRGFTENPASRVILSIAGGRKSMSAIGALCMTLLGREGDRLCHVLVNPPFDQRLEPPFFFPEKNVSHRLPGTKKAFASGKAVVSLHDLPFPRCRNLFQEQLGRLPCRFAEIVAAANRGAAEMRGSQVRIELDPARLGCRINGKSVKLGFAEYLIYWLLCRRRLEMLPPLSGYKELHAHTLDFWQRCELSEKMHHEAERKNFAADPELANKKVSSLKRKLETGGAPPACLPVRGKGRYGLEVQPARISISNA